MRGVLANRGHPGQCRGMGAIVTGFGLASTAAESRTAIKGLCFRLRWSDVYEQGILSGETRADERMMSINQERFEDNQDAIQ